MPDGPADRNHRAQNGHINENNVHYASGFNQRTQVGDTLIQIPAAEGYRENWCQII